MIIHFTASPCNHFLVKPGRGERFVYVPAGHNATVECAVNDANRLGWLVDRFDPEFHIGEQRIFQSGPTRTVTGVMSSTLTINENTNNSGIELCCQARLGGPVECCTTLVFYGMLNIAPFHVTHDSVCVQCVHCHLLSYQFKMLVSA